MSGWFDDRARRPRPGLRAHAAAGKAPLIEGQARVLTSETPSAPSCSSRPAHLPREVRLWPGARGRGQQARDRLRQGRHQEGDRQLCRAGLSACARRATPAPSSRRSGRAPCGPGGRVAAGPGCARGEALERRGVRGAEDGARRALAGRAVARPSPGRSPRASPRSPSAPAGADRRHRRAGRRDRLAGPHRRELPGPADRPVLGPWQPCRRPPPAGHAPDPARRRPRLRLRRARHDPGLPAGARAPGQPAPVRRMLDLGCGSGILAIAAARLWPARVIAADNDPVAVGVARANARRNGVGRRVRALASEGYATRRVRAGGPFDLISPTSWPTRCASWRARRRVTWRRAASLVLSGLLDRQARGDRGPPAPPAGAPGADRRQHLDHAGAARPAHPSAPKGAAQGLSRARGGRLRAGSCGRRSGCSRRTRRSCSGSRGTRRSRSAG